MGGRSAKLTEEQKERLKEMLKKRDSWTTKEVQELIEVKHSSWQVRRILKSFGMKYVKPYQKDYRKPDNAEVDEMAVEANANTARLWSFGKRF